ncbi:tripartite motif-containing protein 2-like [Mercenaria mercenaria]|uniref:tripartite motif-containing protein 2-like n=1 Tax=Mercenaria mercenaria TaxID=6596 RepID=UPI00234EFEE2|nr:tripartite motif-containing protein 2-like [Mercenaria mercenaria]
MQYTFEENEDMENMLSKQNAFGKLTLSPDVTSKVRKPVESFTYKGCINLKTKSDQYGCFITGCVLLSSNKLVVADKDNEKLKVVDIKDKAVIEEITLSSQPWDIAVMPLDQVAVTMPDKKEILIMTTAGKLPTIFKFPVKGECRGVDFHQGHLYIVSIDPKCVFITDTQGNVQNTINLDNKISGTPNYLLLSKDPIHIFISIYGSNSVVDITLQGDTSAEYKNKDFISPEGMMISDDGSLLVCCSSMKGSIHGISADLNQGDTMYDELSFPYSLCYNRDQHEVYVGCVNDYMIVLSAK